MNINKIVFVRNLFIFMIFILCLPGLYSAQKLYKVSEPLPVPRQMYGTVILGDYLYVIGGNIQGKGDDPEGYVTTVEMAHINQDGSIGNWERTTPLPTNRCYISNSTLALNDMVYIVMGTNGRSGSPTKTIYWTRPLANGHLEPWRESSSYPGPGLGFVTAISTPGYINVIGGKDTSNVIHREVWSAKIGPDGSILGWEESHPIPIPLYFHCSAVAGGRVWVWGGIKDRQTVARNNQVFAAPILSSGKIGKFTSGGSTLPRAFYHAAVTVSGQYILTFCPKYTPSEYSNDIWYAKVNPSGGLSQWFKIPTDISVKLYRGVATDYRRNYVYIPGGRINHEEDENSLDGRVYYFKLADSEDSGTRTETATYTTQHTPASGDEHLSYVQQSLQMTSAFPGFLPFERVRHIDKFQNKPQVLYFYTDKAKRCLRQAQILQSFDANKYGGMVVFSEVKVKSFPQISQQYGVFRVPYWIFFDGSGVERYKESKVFSNQELDTHIRKIIR
jgi:hypothetical protein